MEYKGITLTLDMEDSEFNSAINRVRNSTNAWDNDIKKLKQNLKFDGKNVEQYTALVDKLKNKYKETEDAVKFLKDVLDKSLESGRIKKYDSEWVSLTNTITNLEKNLQITGRNIKEVENDWKQNGKVGKETLNGLNRELQEQGESWDRAANKSDTFFANLKANLVSDIISGGFELLKKGIDTVLNGIKKLASGYADLMKQGIEYNATIQDHALTLEMILGQTDGTVQKIVSNMKTLGATYGYEVGTLLEGVENLVVAGVDVGKAEQAMTGFAKALALAGKGTPELKRVITNLQQIQSAGSATARDLREFANAGVPFNNMLIQYVDGLEEGFKATDVTFENIVEAITKATNDVNSAFSKGGEIANLTFSGQVNQIEAKWQQLLGILANDTTFALTTKVLPTFNEFFSELINTYNKYYEEVGKLGKGNNGEFGGGFFDALTSDDEDSPMQKVKEVFRERIHDLINVITEMLPEFLDGATFIIETIGEAFDENTEQGKANCDAFKELVKKFLELVGDVIEEMGEFFTNGGRAIGAAIAEGAMEAFKEKFTIDLDWSNLNFDLGYGTAGYSGSGGYSGGFGSNRNIPLSMLNPSKYASGGIGNVTINVSNNGRDITPTQVRGWVSIINEELGKQYV